MACALQIIRPNLTIGGESFKILFRQNLRPATMPVSMIFGLCPIRDLRGTERSKAGNERMNEMIAYCGLVCQSCPIYLATRESNDTKKRQMQVEIAQQCNKYYGTEYKPQDITDCDGCKTEGGRLFSGCQTCQIRACAKDRSIDNCGHCAQYACEKLAKLFAMEPQAKERLEAMSKHKLSF
jgi:hypothetical protein